MDCRNALLLISPHLDGMLSNEDDAALAEHLAGCEACARELALGRRLSVALREIGREDIQAPTELGALVMAKLRTQRGKSLAWLPAAWRSAIAAAAAILLIAGGSAGVATGLRIADVGKMIGLTTPAPPVNVDTGGGVSVTEKAPVGETSPPNASTQNPNDSGVTDGVQQGNPVDGTKGNSEDSPNINDNNTGQTTAAPSVEGHRAFLASELKIRSTVLRVAVEDLAEARAKAVSMAAGAGALAQVFPEGKKDVMMRITVPSDYAPQLVSDLARTGSLINREDGSSDVTSSYNETVVQYNDLQSRKSTARDAEEKRQLEAQAASCEQLLDVWQSDAGKRVITLWLEAE